MDLTPYLRAHAFLQVEQPPAPWSVATEEQGFLHLLGEMIAAGLARGSALGDLVLNVGNVVVEPAASGHGMPAGEFVALSIQGTGAWGPEGRWSPGLQGAPGILGRLSKELERAQVAWAYVRDLGSHGSLTICLRRLTGAALEESFAAAFNRGDLDALVDLLAPDATAEVLDAGFPVERGAEAIARTSLPYLLGAEDPLRAATVLLEGRPWVLLRTAAGTGAVDMALRLEAVGDRVVRIEYVTAAHQPGPLRRLVHPLGLATTADPGT
jgi:hypothetical protein